MILLLFAFACHENDRAAARVETSKPVVVTGPARVQDTPAEASLGPDTLNSVVTACQRQRSPLDSVRSTQRGARLFRTKGCVRCHTVGAGYREGPDLDGVAARQSCAWIVALLTDTENMIQTDPELQQLRIEHFLDMPNLDLSMTDARALYDYLRSVPINNR